MSSSLFSKASNLLANGLLSQFFIIGGAGAVESTVVGHLKTVLIVLLGSCKYLSCHMSSNKHLRKQTLFTSPMPRSISETDH